MHVIAGPKDIYDHNGEVVDFVCCDLNGLNAVEGYSVGFAKDSFGVCFNCCWGVFEASQLLDSFAPPTVEGFAAEGLARGDVGTKVSEVFDHFDVVANFWS